MDELSTFLGAERVLKRSSCMRGGGDLLLSHPASKECASATVIKRMSTVPGGSLALPIPFRVPTIEYLYVMGLTQVRSKLRFQHITQFLPQDLSTDCKEPHHRQIKTFCN
eukprot:scaffold12307_cov102-Skeletonema_dohrnii-CCMP3373.AAC.2